MPGETGLSVMPSRRKKRRKQKRRQGSGVGAYGEGDGQNWIGTPGVTRATIRVDPVPKNAVPGTVSLMFEDYGDILGCGVIRGEGAYPYALVTYESLSAAKKAVGGNSKAYLFPEIRGRRTRVVMQETYGDDTELQDSDDELLAMHPPTKRPRAADSDVKTAPTPAERPAPPSDPDKIISIEEPRLLSRLLYPNPVCLLVVAPPLPLSSKSEPKGLPASENVMTCSWLTPADNKGTFLMVINKKRHTASLLDRHRGAQFTLSVPTHEHTDTVLAIGRQTGAKMNKFEALKVTTCSPGWPEKRKKRRSAGARPQLGAGGNRFAGLELVEDDASSDSASADAPEPAREGEARGDEKQKGQVAAAAPADEAPSPRAGASRLLEGLGSEPCRLLAVKFCVCHIACRVDQMLPDLVPGHWVVKARAEQAWVRASHWCGKNFRPRTADAGKLLTFLGAQKFGWLGPVAI